MQTPRRPGRALLTALFLSTMAAAIAAAGTQQAPRAVVPGSSDPAFRILAVLASGDGAGGMITAAVERRGQDASILRIVRFDAQGVRAAEAAPISIASHGARP